MLARAGESPSRAWVSALEVLHLREQGRKVWAVPPGFARGDRCGRCGNGQRRLVEDRIECRPPRGLERVPADTYSRSLGRVVDRVAPEQLSRIGPQRVERLLAAMMRFVAAIAKPDGPVGCVLEVIAHFFETLLRDLCE